MKMYNFWALKVLQGTAQLFPPLFPPRPSLLPCMPCFLPVPVPISRIFTQFVSPPLSPFSSFLSRGPNLDRFSLKHSPFGLHAFLCVPHITITFSKTSSYSPALCCLLPILVNRDSQSM